MRLGEVCLMTADAPRLAAFYRHLLSLPQTDDSGDHQFITNGEVSLAVYNDGAPVPSGQTAALAFTTEDIQADYRRLSALGADILQPPMTQPWGAVNMILRDPDGRRVYVREIKRAESSAGAAIDSFVVCIDGRQIGNYHDFINVMQREFHFPRDCCGSIDRYLDWMRDLSWITENEIIIRIEYALAFMRSNPQEKQLILDDINDIIMPFWEQDAANVIVDGVRKSCRLLLIP